MTVATTVASHTPRFSFILCVEGIGWPENPTVPSDGFLGDIFVTHDYYRGTSSSLSTVFSGADSVRFGLELPPALSVNFDPRVLDYSGGSIDFKFVNLSDYWFTKFTPNLLSSGGAKVSQLYQDLTYASTEPRFDEASVTFATGDKVWVSARELILLGTRTNVAGSVYRYPSSTRGYLGTQRGRRNDDPVTTAQGSFTWPGSSTAEQGTVVRNYDKFPAGRLVRLYVVTDTGDDFILLYTGRVTGGRFSEDGTLFTLSTQFAWPRMQRTHKPLGTWQAQFTRYQQPGATSAGGGVQRVGATDGSAPAQTEASYPTTMDKDYLTGTELPVYMQMRVGNGIVIAGSIKIWAALGYVYAYRNFCTGGTAGVLTAIDSDVTNPQAAVDSTSRDIVSCLASINGQFYRVLFRTPESTATFRDFYVETVNLYTGNVLTALPEAGAPVSFCLDNIEENARYSRFALGTKSGGGNFVSRNPIDVLLMFLTSVNGESYVADAAAAGTTTTVNFTAPGWTTDQWTGYALHCVEGDNAGEARVITGNDSDTITVDAAFTSSTHSGNEYQIRNTVYDVLPLSWGMGLRNEDIDIQSFELVRDKHLAGEEIGRFALPGDEEIDLWALVQDNICIPYGILLYVSNSTGKLSARYIGDIGLRDGLDEDETHITIGASSLLEIGDLEITPRPPIKSITLKVRRTGTAAVIPKTVAKSKLNYDNTVSTQSYQDSAVADPSTGGKSASIEIKSGELDNASDGAALETLEYTCMLSSVDDSGALQVRMMNRLLKESTPDPEIELTLSVGSLATIQPGSLLALTDTTALNPLNPYTGSRGWSALVARVLGLSFSLMSDPPHIKARVALLPSISSGRVPPACAVSSKGNDATGDYFVVSFTTPDYDNDVQDIDFHWFAVDDRIELRSADGALKEGPEVIAFFGTNLSTDPDNADSGRIYIDGTIASAIAAGDYITFSAWVAASVTTNQELFVALADSSDTLDGDSAFVYSA